MSRQTVIPTAGWITASREVVAETLARLGATLSRIAVNHRRLNPWWGASGSSNHDGDRALLQSILDHLRWGILVPAPGQVWAEKGTGQICTVYTQPIHP